MRMPEDITLLLKRAAAGDKTAETALLDIVYEELKRRAAAYLARERRDHTLQATALVHEAYVRLAGQLDRDWKNRSHFFGVAAHFMRIILVDHARAHGAEKRGGQAQRVDLEELDRPRLFAPEQYEHLIALDDALAELESYDDRAVRVVELRFFGDLTTEEAAQVLGVSTRTVKNDWKFARNWLHQKLSPAGS